MSRKDRNRTLELQIHHQSKKDIGYVVAKGRSAPLTYCAVTGAWNKDPTLASVYSTPSEAQDVIASLCESGKPARVMKISSSSQYVSLSDLSLIPNESMV